MEERLKQRLVGAVVLVSLAVVFVPILFDLPPEVDEGTTTIVISGIPERPRDGFGSSTDSELGAPQTPRLDDEVERERNREAPSESAGDRAVSVTAPPDDSVSSSSGTAAPSADASASERPASATGTEPSVARSDSAPAAARAQDGSEKKSGAGGWTVQLGSFLKSENALALHKRLQARGYTAFVESGTSERGNVSRVFVGPMADREQARSSAAKLQRELQIEGIVVPYRGG